jgi:hypothetical protein
MAFNVATVTLTFAQPGRRQEVAPVLAKNVAEQVLRFDFLSVNDILDESSGVEDKIPSLHFHQGKVLKKNRTYV